MKVILTENRNYRKYQEAKSFCNTYSVSSFHQFCNEFAYNVSEIKRFDLDIDIKKPTDINIIGT